MINELTTTQLAKILVGKKYLSSSKDPDRLYHVVVIVGPSILGSLIGSNSDTVWSKIENPGNFRYAEMEIFSEIFDMSIERILVAIKKQIEHNLEETEEGRPIGRKRYNDKHSQDKHEIVKSSRKSKKK